MCFHTQQYDPKHCCSATIFSLGHNDMKISSNFPFSFCLRLCIIGMILVTYVYFLRLSCGIFSGNKNSIMKQLEHTP